MTILSAFTRLYMAPRGKQVRFLSEGERQGVTALVERFPMFFDLLSLLVADCEASAHRASGWAPILAMTLEVVDHIERVCGLARARTVIDGHVLKRMGIEPGPRLGRILDRVHDRILAGEIRTREEAMEWVRGRLADDDELDGK